MTAQMNILAKHLSQTDHATMLAIQKAKPTRILWSNTLNVYKFYSQTITNTHTRYIYKLCIVGYVYVYVRLADTLQAEASLSRSIRTQATLERCHG